MSWEDVYQTRVKAKIKFVPQDFYEKFKKFLESRKWNGIFKKDRYEKYYYHKLTPDGLLFLEIQWEMYKNYWKEEPKIDWKLEITILVNGYNINTLVGDLDVSIKSSHKVEEFKEPEIKTESEKFLSYLGFKKVMKNLVSNLEKVRGKNKLLNMSGRDLYEESEKIKNWILDYFKLYKY